MRSIVLTPQGMRDCRWSQPELRPGQSIEEDLWEASWECIRVRGQERPLIEAECAGCEHWEPDPFF
jgi:hypothetical protein